MHQMHVVAQVLVTGASGKTGALVVSQCLKLPDQFLVRTVVRSAAVGEQPAGAETTDG